MTNFWDRAIFVGSWPYPFPYRLPLEKSPTFGNFKYIYMTLLNVCDYYNGSLSGKLAYFCPDATEISFLST